MWHTSGCVLQGEWPPRQIMGRCTRPYPLPLFSQGHICRHCSYVSLAVLKYVMLLLIVRTNEVNRLLSWKRLQLKSQGHTLCWPNNPMCSFITKWLTLKARYWAWGDPKGIWQWATSAEWPCLLYLDAVSSTSPSIHPNLTSARFKALQKLRSRQEGIEEVCLTTLHTSWGKWRLTTEDHQQG